MNKLYKSIYILQIKDQYELEMSKFTHSYYHKKLPISNLLINITTMSLDQFLKKQTFSSKNELTVYAIFMLLLEQKFGITFHLKPNCYLNSPSIKQ